MVNLKALSARDMEDFLAKSVGLPSYRAKQLLHWIYEKGATDINEITEFSKPLRERLSRTAYISNLELIKRQVSADGTEKFLFGLEDGNRIESVLIPEGHGPPPRGDRLTLCVSSQAGCALGCRFCITGRSGFARDLEAHEIVDQFLSARRKLPGDRALTNIVFMGMGEPLNNLENVSEALWRLTGPAKFSKRRVTVSTSGNVPGINRLPAMAPAVNLAVSLNAADDRTRDSLMPINKRYKLKDLFGALRRYPLPARGRITFEYVLIKDVNDRDEDARRLIKLLQGMRCKVNLIPFNESAGILFRAPSEGRVLAFQKILTDADLTALVRKSKGADIRAACGQLRADYG
jgi:23S rRNA (adenine2503-C2)-methyltransferase